MKPQLSPLPSGATSVVVAIGADDARDWPPSLRPALSAHRVVHVPWPRLTRSYLGTLSPDTVVTPLVAAEFDAVEAAAWLGRNGYDGRLVVAMARPLPDARLVQREISAAGGGMRVDMLSCD